jgi:hypothetical protein
LAAAAAVTAMAATGCTVGEDRRARDRPQPEPSVDPDVAVAAAALAEQRAMVTLLRTTLDRHGGLAGDLGPLLTTHEAHVALLADAVPPGVGATPSAAVPGDTETPATPLSPSAADTPSAGRSDPAPSRGPSAGPSDDLSEGAQVPRRPREALAAVAASEHRLSLATKQHAFAAESGAFARVLASMAAAAAQHSAVLTGPGAARSPGRSR